MEMTSLSNPKVIALLQARTTSSRLPNKVLLPILGVPMILRQIERLQRADLINQVVVVTSTEVSDDGLAATCAENNILCFRGSLNDVLDRFYQAAKSIEPSHVIRLTADCPLADPELIDQVIQFYFDGDFDYVSNAIEPTYPDGLDAEIFNYNSLCLAWSEAKLPSEREHVTPFIREHSQRFKIGSYKGETDLSSLRWTVDEQRDFTLIEKIYSMLYPSNPAFSTKDILVLLKENPELLMMNVDIIRNEGLLKSFQHDKEFIKNKTTKLSKGNAS